MGLISTFNRILRHSALFEAMVGKLGVRAELAGLPNAAAVSRRAVNRCISCSNPDGCDFWLDSTVSADEAPSFCRNHDMLAQLKQATKVSA